MRHWALNPLRALLKYHAGVRQFFGYISIFVLYVAISLLVSAESRLDSVYAQWRTLSTDSLFSRGISYYEKHQDDSALICFSICGNRPVSAMSTREKSMVVESLTMSARLYFRFFDYGKAYEQLAQAMAICGDKDMGDCMTGVYMEQGALLMTYAHQKPKEENFSRAEQAYRNAFWSALKYEQWPSLQTAFFNLGNHLYGAKRLAEMRRELDAFASAPIPADVPRRQYIRCFHRGLCHVLDGDMSKARQVFRQQLMQVPDDEYSNIYQFEAYTTLVKSFAFVGQLDSAIHYELIMRQLAIETHMKDGEAITARDLADFYGQLGDTATAHQYADAALRSKDSLLAVNNLDQVSALNFVSQLIKQEARIRQQERLSHWLTVGLVVLVMVAASVVAMWLLVWRRRHQATADNRPQTASSPMPKYQASGLDEDNKQQLKLKIQQVLQGNDAVYDQAFCLNQLAELCQSNPKYISQVINELYGCNFATLVSKLRVEEACRRMADKENYGNLSLEGIAYSVGFKSRVTMYQAFKKIMGMTPTDYQKSL